MKRTDNLNSLLKKTIFFKGFYSKIYETLDSFICILPITLDRVDPLYRYSGYNADFTMDPKSSSSSV